MSDTPIYDRLVIESGTEPRPLMTWHLALQNGINAMHERLAAVANGTFVSTAAQPQLIAPAPQWWDVDEWEDDE